MMFILPGLLLVLPSVVLAVPVPEIDVAVIPCTNVDLLRYMVSSNTAYRCSPGTKERIETEYIIDSTLLEPAYVDSFEDGDYISMEDDISMEDRVFVVESKQRHPAVRSSSKKDCKEGEYYQPSLGACLPIKNPNQGPKKDNKNKQANKTRITNIKKNQQQQQAQKTRVKTKGDCKTTEYYNPELGACMKIKNQPIRPKRSNRADNGRAIESFPERFEIIEEIDCGNGFAFDSRSGRCVANRNNFPFQTQAMRRNDQTKKHVEFLAGNDQWTHLSERCPESYVYMSEIDICKPYNQPSQHQIHQLQSASQLFKLEEEKKMRTTTPDPFALTFSPLNSNRRAIRFCPPGAFFFSELGECIDLKKK